MSFFGWKISIMKFRSLILLLALTIGALNINASDKYEIGVKAKQLKSDSLFLGYYYCGKLYVQDTLSLDKNGRGVFADKEKLNEGTYVMYFHGSKYFDLLIGADQEFSVEIGDTLSLPESVKISGAAVSEDFHNYSLRLKDAQEKYNKLSEQLKQTEDSVKKTNIQQEAIGISNYVNTLKDSLLDVHTGDMLGLFLNGLNVPEYKNDASIPDSLKPMHRYLFEKEHYLDNLDITDARIIRTPYIISTLDGYINNKLFQISDSIIPPVIKLVERSRKNEECFRVILNHCMNYAINSKIMGMENLMVELGRRYYLNGLAEWSDSTWLKNLEEEIYKNERSLIGMKAANIHLADINNKYDRLYNIGGTKVTILYFYEPSCGHCRKTMPKVGEFAKKYANDPRIKVVGVYMLEDKEEWSKFIEEADLSALVNVWDPNRESYYWYYFNTSTTPTVYVMDENHKIFAKKIDVDTLYLIAENELK
jgi:thiol-disulfide isomerase/thioredoxin